MTNVINFTDYVKKDGSELEAEILKVVDSLPLGLTETQKQEVLSYGNELWHQLNEIENNSHFSFTLEISCTDEQRARVAEQIKQGVDSVIAPRTKFIQNLIAKLIVIAPSKARRILQGESPCREEISNDFL